MKEITFEELIEEVEYKFDNGNFVVSDTALELLKEVREATIKECIEILNEAIEKSKLILSRLEDGYNPSTWEIEQIIDILKQKKLTL